MSIWLFDVFEIPMRQYLYVMQVLVAEGMFAFFLKRRKNFGIRLSIALSIYFGVSFIVPPLISDFVSHNLFVVFGISFLVFLLCFENKLIDLFFCYVAAITIQNLAYNTGIVLCLLFHVSPDIESGNASRLIQVVAYVIVHLICFFVCACSIKNADTFGARVLPLLFVTMIVISILFILESYLDRIDATYFFVPRTLFLVCDIMALIMLFWMLDRSKVEEEKNILKQLIAKEYSHYQFSKETMEIINMKMHDIKHLLSLIRNGDTKLSVETISEYEKMTETFQNIVRTGNAALDIVLTEKLFLCEKNGIILTYMIDETGIVRLRPEDIVSIFGNLLDNAIQYLSTIENREYRVITLSIKRKIGLLLIHVDNYCNTILECKDGLPLTTNEKKAIHGYGLKSVRYIVEKYNGVMTIYNDENKFSVDISIAEENCAKCTKNDK